jgi:YidC/Oxa1 family membrane protein insertase
LSWLFDIIRIPFGFIIKWLYSLLSNYFVAILLFAVILKLVMFPVGIKQQKNSQKQAALRPKENVIRKKYAGRNDRATQMKMNTEIQELYQKENFSPLGGCLPMMVQMLVLLAVYAVIRAPLTFTAPLPTMDGFNTVQSVKQTIACMVYEEDAEREEADRLINQYVNVNVKHEDAAFYDALRAGKYNYNSEISMIKYLEEEENRKAFIGAVTVDADGQHLIKDIIATCNLMAETNRIVLGCRDFSGKNVPARSKFGNNCTIALMRLFFGMKISDTQTGLRAFPKDVIPELIHVDGDRYEYETHMLFYMNKHNLPFEEVKIETVYIEENSSSHFRPIRDSLRIYSLIIKYLLSSVGSTLLDVIVYYILKALTSSTFLAAFVARAASSLFNYTVNAKAVFGESINVRTLIRYYILVIVQICVSACSVFLIETVFGITSPALSTVIKAIVDAILFFVSFRIQHKWVFGEKKKKD